MVGLDALEILRGGFCCHDLTLDETVPMRSAVRGILGNISFKAQSLNKPQRRMRNNFSNMLHVTP